MAKAVDGTVGFLHVVLILLVGLGLSGCVTYGDIDNLPQFSEAQDKHYSVGNSQSDLPFSDTAILLAFSGGGTRAAATAY